jgi:hypothetical protein
MSILDRTYRVIFENGEMWDIPVRVIAVNRANYFMNRGEFDSIESSLEKDTVPLFEFDNFEIKDWAQNNMDWGDVVEFAKRVCDADEVDYTSMWINPESSDII